MQKKSKQKIILIIGIVCLLIFLGGYYWYEKAFKDVDEKNPTKEMEISTDETKNQNHETEADPEGYVFVENGDVDTVYEVDEDSISYDENEQIQYVNNILLIFFNDNVSSEQKKEVAASVNGKIVGQMDTMNQIQVRIEQKSFGELEQLCEKLMNHEYVEYATYDEINEISVQYIPDDPWQTVEEIKNHENEQDWDVDNPAGRNWYCEAIEAPGAWDYLEEMEDINVGVLDAELYGAHEDFTGKVTYHYKEDVLPKNYQYECAHGTHVTGIIAAEHNGKGIAGIAPIFHIQYIDFKRTKNTIKERPPLDASEELNDNEKKSSDLNDLKYVIELVRRNKCKVVNMSMGWKKTNKGKKGINRSGYLSSKCISCLLDKGEDFVIVQSAGNGKENKKLEKNIGIDAIQNGLFCCVTEENYYDEKYDFKEIKDRIIIVGACDEPENGVYYLTEFSNTGEQVDICAPGRHIYSTIHPYTYKDKNDNEIFVDGWYGYMSGTSMSAPIVTSVCAMAWSVAPQLTGPQIKEIVCNSNCTVVYGRNTDSDSIYRMVNAKLAVEAALKKAGKPIKETMDPTELFAQLPEHFVFSSGVGAWATNVYIQDDGTFIGEYRDDNQGDVGEGYPDGSVVICRFSGKFTNVKKVDEYTYSMELEYINTEEPDGKIYYKDNKKYICSYPYGFDNAEEFMVYLPGIPLSRLSEDFISWIYSLWGKEIMPSGTYGIYNVKGQYGFFGSNNPIYSNENNGQNETEQLLDLFLKGEEKAYWSYDSDQQFLITDLTAENGWVPFSVGERTDLDNDGEQEQILHSDLGDIYLDVRDHKVFVFEDNYGMAEGLSYTEYEGAIWIVYSDTQHAGRQIYQLTQYAGTNNVMTTFTLSAEYWDKQNGSVK